MGCAVYGSLATSRRTSSSVGMTESGRDGSIGGVTRGRALACGRRDTRKSDKIPVFVSIARGGRGCQRKEVREMTEEKKSTLEKLYELAAKLPPLERRFLLTYGEALADAQEIKKQSA